MARKPTGDVDKVMQLLLDGQSSCAERFSIRSGVE